MDVLVGTGVWVGDLLDRTADRTPDREALVFLPESGSAGARLTYAELLAEARGMSGYLMERFPVGSRVAIWARNDPAWILLQLGAYLAGLVVVAVNPAYGESETEVVLRVAHATLLVHDRDPEVAGRLADRLGIAECCTLAEMHRHAAGAVPATRPVPPGAVAQIQFTSGTTGEPKAAQLTHAGLTTTPVIASRCLGLADGARWLSVTPLFHIAGCILPVLGCLALGATHVLGERYRPDLVLTTFGAERISFFGGVPTMWWDLLERHDPARHRTGSLEVLMTGGAPVPHELVRRAESVFGAHVVVAYGQTEAHGHITQTHIVGAPDPGNRTPSAIGRALPHTRIRILRPDGSQAGPGETGELVASSPTLMLGYLGRPDETARSLDADGALHTGDLCSMDADGVVSFVGRVSDLIVRGGEKIAPAEVEAALVDHPSVSRAAVAGVPDVRLGQRVAAFVVTGDKAHPDPEDLVRHLQTTLARYKIPEVWEFVDDLPVSATGKVSKDVLVRSWQRHGST